MRRYRIWQIPALAFFSTQFYRELGAKGKGIGFVYLFTLLTIVCAINPIKELTGLQPPSLSILDRIPVITIERGKVSIEDEVPYVVNDPQTGDNLIVIDTGPQPQCTVNTPVLITQDSILVRLGDQLHQFSTKELDHYQFVPEQFKRVLTISSYLWNLPLTWLGHIIQALGFSLAGLVLAKTISVKIKYEGILRIACVALGNVILLDGLIHIFPLEIPNYGLMEMSIPSWGLYKFVIALGFTLFGVGANLSPPSFEPAAEASGSEAMPSR